VASGETLSLSALLSRVLGHLTTELEVAVAVGAEMPSLAVWSNVVRCVADAGTEGLHERALPGAARISRRLAVPAVRNAVRRGWISAHNGLDGDTSQYLFLSDSGQAATEVWRAQLATLDTTSHGDQFRAVLEALVGQLQLELPHFPVSYGAADPSAIGSCFVPPRRADGIPAHGTDWTPILRGDGDTVSFLPLTALLSQALMAFTIDYESGFPWPLASTATVLCHLSAEPRPLADIPGEHGIAGNGKSLLERHLIAVVTRDPADPKTKLVRLTERGQAVVQRHPGRLETVESAWRERHGDAVIDGLRDGLGFVANTISEPQPDHVTAPSHLG
jgi:hypothetical protein